MHFKAYMFGACEFGLVGSGDHFGVKTIPNLDKAWHDALIINNNHFNSSRYQSKFRHEMIACHGNSLTHHQFIAGTA